MTQYTKPTAEAQRNHFLTVWLTLVIIFNLFTLVSFLTGGNNPLAYITPDDNMLLNSPAVIIVNVAAAAAIVCSALILVGYRLGYYGLVLSFVVMTIASLMIGFNIIMVLIAGLVALITWVVMQPSWARMK